MTTGQRWSLALAASSLVWCMVAGWWIWVTPVGGNPFADVSLFGPAPLIVPALLAALATWAAWRRRRGWLVVATLLACVFTFASGFSIGGFYLPAAAALVFATLVGVGG